MQFDKLKNSRKLQKALLKKLSDGAERGGVILPDLTIVEFENTSEDPDAYKPALGLDDIEALNTCVATWHTHPNAGSNLSAGDAETFKAWPNCAHVIIGVDGLSWYLVRNGAVVNA